MAKKQENDVTKEDNKATFRELFNRIECDTGLIFVDTPEETRLIREVYKEYNNQIVQFWSIRFGLHIIDSQITEIPDEFMPHDYNPEHARKGKSTRIDSRNSLLDALTIIEDDCREKIDPDKPPTHKNIYILRDADKFFQNPAILRAVRDLIYMASCSGSTIIMTGFGVTVPNDIIKDSVYLKINYPTKKEILNDIIPLVEEQIKCHNEENPKPELQIDSNFDKEEISRACAGLTEDQILNVLQYTTTVDNKVCVDRVLEEKKAIINKSDILEYWICDTSLDDVGGFGELKEWFNVRKVVMTSPHAKSFKAKYPKGIMLLGVQGSGKAQPLYSKIQMENRKWKQIGEIEVGDRIRTPSGKVQPIKEIFEHSQKECYRVTFRDGRFTDCCDEHLWKIYNKNFKSDSCTDGWKVVDTKELIRLMKQKSDTRRFYVPLLEEADDNPVELPIDPYILGILIGDGCLKQNVQFTTADQEIVDKVSSKLDASFRLHHVAKKDRCDDYRISLVKNNGHTRNGYREILEIYGLWNKGSHEKFIPERYMRGSKSQKIELLQGLMDSDGYANTSLSYSTVSHTLAKNVRDLVRSIGGQAYISNKVTTCSSTGLEYMSFLVNIRYRDPKELVSLTRKKNTISDNYQYSDLKLEIHDIDYIGKEDMRCIMLDDNDHLYITDDYIVTHNTYIAKSVAASLGMGLIKLEMGKVFAGLVGESEKRMRQALAQIEAAGGVVIVDEIDKGLSGAGSSDKTDGGTTSRVIGTLLTWLQEDHPGVFLIATANDISALLNNHPELLRKGRFDEIWFSDLPTKDERKDIFKIHISKNDRDPSKFDLDSLAEVEFYDNETGRTYGYTGAEIEYAVNDSIQEAFAQGGGKKLKIGGSQDITTELVSSKLSMIKPMSKIGHEPINKMRRWASDNARNVSNKAEPYTKAIRPKASAGARRKNMSLRAKGKKDPIDCEL